MLSSFTSFLPSRLQGVTSKELPRSIVNPNEDQSDDENEPEALAQPENKLKLKDRDGKGPSEVGFLSSRFRWAEWVQNIYAREHQ